MFFFPQIVLDTTTKSETMQDLMYYSVNITACCNFIYTYMHIHIYTHMHGCTLIWIYTHSGIWMHTYTYIRVYIQSVWVYVCLFISICMYINRNTILLDQRADFIFSQSNLSSTGSSCPISPQGNAMRANCHLCMWGCTRKGSWIYEIWTLYRAIGASGHSPSGDRGRETFVLESK